MVANMKKNLEVDKDEISKFEAMASEWWDPDGKFKPLHMLNPCRLAYITNQIKAHFNCDYDDFEPFKGIKVLDIGCGGGLLTEPIARLGASVVGVDPAEKNIKVAQLHLRKSNLDIDYRVSTAEKLLAKKEFFDVILNMEVVEHVPDPLNYLRTCSKLLKNNGIYVIEDFKFPNYFDYNRNTDDILVDQLLEKLKNKEHFQSKYFSNDEQSFLMNSISDISTYKGNLPESDICFIKKN
mgnify:CR=1 FL=1